MENVGSVGIMDYFHFSRRKFQKEIREIQLEMNRRDTVYGVLGLKDDIGVIKTSLLFMTYISLGILSCGLVFVYDFFHLATYDAAEREFKNDEWSMLVYDKAIKPPVYIASIATAIGVAWIGLLITIQTC